MIRGITANGNVLVGLTRSSLDKLLKGESLISPGFDGRGPDVLLVFAEDDKALRAKLTEDGHMRPHTLEFDRRRS